MSEPPTSTAGVSGPTATAPPPTGCCNITFDDGTGQQFENITEEACRQKASDLGGSAQWVAGDCA
jgi:hypothetical protein